MIGATEAIEVARLHGPGDVRVHREAIARPDRDEAALRVTAVGLCGSDRHWFEEGSIGDARLSRPLVLGHEFAGVISDGEQAGQRVVADPADTCGDCELCLAGRSNLCRSIRFAGHGTTDGALRSQMTWPGRLLYPLPERIDDDAAALLEPLGVAIRAVELGQPLPGGSAAVLGCGPIGLMLVALLRIAGLSRVVATDRLPHRVAAATRMGAHDATEVVAGEPLVAATSTGGEVDVVFEAAGDDDALADATALVRPGGRVVIVGIPPHDRTSFQASVARRKELTIVLSRRMLPVDLERAIGLAGEGAVDLGSLISHRFPIARAHEAFDVLMRRTGLKVIVNPTTSGL